MTNQITPKVITIEGGEGSGKTTVIGKIKDHLESKGIDVLITREPGGVRISEHIRSIILEKTYVEMDPRTEALLFAAARRQHLVEKVLPAIQAGKWVIFDRFVDSSVVYQGYVRGIGIDEVYQMNVFATEHFLPDLTLYLDVAAEIGLSRINSDPDREVNKLDLEGIAFHKKVRDGYLDLVKKYPNRIKCIDASAEPKAVFEAIVKEIEVLL